MTDVAYALGQTGANASSTSTSFTDIASGSDLNAGDLQADEEYLLIFRTGINGSSGSQNFEFQIEAGGSEVSGSDISYSKIEPRRTGATYAHEHFFLHRYTVPGTPVDISQQYKAPSGYTVRSSQRFALALKLGTDSDALAINTDVFFDEDTTNYNALSSGAYTSTASVTIGNGSDDYLILACIHSLVNSTSEYLNIRLGGDIDDTPYMSMQGEDTNEVWQIPFFHTLSAPDSGTTVQVEVSTSDSSTGAFDVTNVRLVALRLNRFTDHVIASSETSTALSSEDTWYELHGNVGYTASEDQDAIAMAGFLYSTGDTSKALKMRLVDDSSGNFGGVTDHAIHVTNGSADRRLTLAMAVEDSVSESTALSTDWDAQETADVSPAPERIRSDIVIFSTSLNAHAVSGGQQAGSLMSVGVGY